MGWLRTALRLEPDGPGTIEDPRFGPVLVTPGTPYVISAPTLGRLELVSHKKRARIGEREFQVRPSRAIGRRAADDVKVLWDGHELQLKHTGRKRAKLRLDGRTVARLDQVKRARAELDSWRELYDVRWEQDVDADVALLGHVLASRYGVGADGALLRLLENAG